jgi:hypothetical protein
MTPILSGPGERVARAARRRGDFGDRRQRAPRVLDDRLGARRDRDGAALALEDAHAEFRLQLEDLTAQRRLADVAGRRGAAEVTVVGDGDDILEIAQVHGVSLHNRPGRLQIDQQSIGPIESAVVSLSPEAVTARRSKRRSERT